MTDSPAAPPAGEKAASLGRETSVPLEPRIAAAEIPEVERNEPTSAGSLEEVPSLARPPDQVSEQRPRHARLWWLVALILAGALFYPGLEHVKKWRTSSTPFAPQEIRSMAVLPMANLSGDPEQQWSME